MRCNQSGLLFRVFVIGLVTLWGGSLYAAEVVFKAEIPKPQKTSVYKMEEPRLSKEEVYDRCAGILKVSGVESFSTEKFKPVEDRYAMFGDDITCSMNKNGTEYFYSDFAALNLTGKTSRLFSDEEAVKLSRDYLEKTGLMPANEKELRIDHVGGIMQMLSNAESPEKKAVVVYFYRELDGLRVRNFGSSITVTLAENEVPAGVQYRWREVASRNKVGKRGFLDAEEVKKLVRDDINRVYAKDAEVTVDNIELVLYDNGGAYIQPAYLYEGTSRSSAEGVADMPVAGYVAALSEIYEPIHHPAYSPQLKNPTTRQMIRHDEKDD
ncbi:hypothetical protein OO006_08470 [Prosthecochloris sp. SCSIO W1101]|uniref:hypothetical protein n=1 Tax=Prosthecochloris sp. SCSIO W1101 TaxID=2992242 RepID=UPI00223D7E12|nr:hypothetical protein [Prosthecochloris sp. SCSIO W1101]UZJ40400.1 hypothetical protein OO006_08470 [Prosthecochloris sp. SCSIO W1101]